MKKSILTVLLISISTYVLFAQLIKIDGADVGAGIKLPTWLNENQTLQAHTDVSGISVLEFSVVGTQLEFSRVLMVSSTPLTVPAGKVWKIESIHHHIQSASGNSPQSNTVVGDIKMSYVVSDHDGWIKLDGRNLNTLSSNQLVAAYSFGFTTHLPDATDKVLKQKNNEDFEGGSNSVVILQENLPNITFTGSTDIAGEHSHTVSSHTHGGSHGLNGTSFSYNMAPHISANITSSTDGAHTHEISINTGGNDIPLNIESAWLNVNIFIYLGE